MEQGLTNSWAVTYKENPDVAKVITLLDKAALNQMSQHGAKEKKNVFLEESLKRGPWYM